MKGLKMKVNIIEIGTQEMKDKTSFDYVKCLATVQKFGKPSLELIIVKVPTKTGFKLGEANLDIVLPYSEYSYTLA